jgi:hypothetical protein
MKILLNSLFENAVTIELEKLLKYKCTLRFPEVQLTNELERW